MLVSGLVMLTALVIGLALLGIKIYGVILCFKKKWYIGVVALLVPFFPEAVALTKLVFKKDLLK